MTVPGPLFPLESGPDIARSRTLVESQPSCGPSLMKLRQGRWAWGNIEEPARSTIRLRSDPGQMGESPTRRPMLQQCESSFHIY